MSQFGQYEVIRSLAGDRTEAHLARRTSGSEGQEYVLIPLDLGGDDAQRLADELERCRRLDHPALSSVVEVFGHRGRPVLVYDSLPGTNLHRLASHLVKSGEPLPPEVALYVGHVLFDALAAAHGAKRSDGASAPLVHGQLGPHQLLLSWRGAVSLFGLGLYRLHRAVEVLHSVPEVMQPYVAPENRNGSDPKPRSNVFSAAAIVHSLLAGGPPKKDALTFEPTSRVCADLPKEVTKALDEALASAPDSRGITAAELASAFGDALSKGADKQLVQLLEAFRELDHVDAGFMPPECVPSLLQAGMSEPPPGAPSALVFVPRLPAEQERGPRAGRGRRPQGRGVYAIVGGKQLPTQAEDGPEDVGPGGPRRMGQLDAARGKRLGKPKHTMPGTGAAAWKAGAAAELDGEEVPEDRDTLRGAGGPADDGDVQAPSAKSRKKTLVGSFQGLHDSSGSGGATMPRRGGSEPAGSKRGRETLSVKGFGKGAEDSTLEEVAERAKRKAAAAKARRKETKPAFRAAATAQAARAALGVQDEADERDDDLEAVLSGAEDDDLEAVIPSERGGVEPLALAEEEEPGADASSAPDAAPPSEPPAESSGDEPEPESSAPSRPPSRAAEPPAEGKRVAGVPLSWLLVAAVVALVAFGAGMALSSKEPDSQSVGAATSASPGGEPSSAAAARDRRSPPADGQTGMAADQADDGSELPADQGYLMVRSPAKKLRVYRDGVDIGPTDERLRVSCGMATVRLGDAPLESWYSDERKVEVGCQTITMMTITPSRPVAAASPAPTAEKARPTDAATSEPVAATKAPGTVPQSTATAAAPKPTAPAAGKSPKDYWIPPSL